MKYLSAGGVVYVNVARLERGGVLKGKRVLVTGGSSGIGFAIASKCIGEGAKVVITGRSKERLKVACEKLGKNVSPLLWDITDTAVAKEMLARVVSLIGGIDLLINNAGIYSSLPVDQVGQDTWDQVINTNLKGVFFVTQATLPYLRKNPEGGKIIFISSIRGFQGDTVPYGLSKWGVVGFTRGLARDLIRQKIIVNGIAPGITATGINCIDPIDNAYCPCEPRNQRVALPEEIAEIALFLASDAANNIVGQTIVCDGGATLI